MSSIVAINNVIDLIGLDASVELIARTNSSLESMTPIQRVEWSLTHLPGEYVVSSSFGHSRR